MKTTSNFWRSINCRVALIAIAIIWLPIISLSIRILTDPVFQEHTVTRVSWGILILAVLVWSAVSILKVERRRWEKRQLWEKWFAPTLSAFVEMKNNKGEKAVISVGSGWRIS